MFEIRTPHVLSNFSRHILEIMYHVFMHDNACLQTSHAAKLTIAHVQVHNIEMLPLPPDIPDMKS